MDQNRKLPPADLAELNAMIARRQLRLTAKSESVLRHGLVNPLDFACGTAHSVAAASRVSAATVLRLTHALGFNHFAEFRQLFRAAALRAASRRPTLSVNSSRSMP